MVILKGLIALIVRYHQIW